MDRGRLGQERGNWVMGVGSAGGQTESESCCCCISVFFMSGQFTGRLFTVWYLTLLDQYSQWRHPSHYKQLLSVSVLFYFICIRNFISHIFLLFMQNIFIEKIKVLSPCVNNTIIFSFTRK